MAFLKALDGILIRIIHPILIVIGLAVAFLLVIGIFSRAVLGVPVFGLEEIILLAVMWFYMLGAVLASRERTHLGADFVQVVSKSETVRRGAAIVSTLISLGVALMFVVWAWDLTAWGIVRGQTTPVFAIPWVVSQASLFIASIFFTAYLVRDLVVELTGNAPQDDSNHQPKE